MSGRLLCVPFVLMGKAKGTRWGRGSRVGYDLEIGDALRAQISRNREGRWVASITTISLGTYDIKEEAMRRVEETMRHDMSRILEDWALKIGRYGTARPKKAGERIVPFSPTRVGTLVHRDTPDAGID